MPKYGLGLKPSIVEESDLRFSAIHPLAIDLPKTCDLLTPYKPPHVDQMSVGMCTGCGSTRAAKTRMNYVGYKWPYTPSALYLYAKVREFEGTPLTEDSGASIKDIFNVWNKQGVCPEDSNPEWSWPFSASDGRWMVAPPKACEENATTHKMVKYMRLDHTEQDIKSALCQGFPIVIGIAVYDSMMSSRTASSGVISKPKFLDTLEGYHCFTGDTEVKLLDGTSRSLKFLAENYANQTFWVYSCDDNGNVVPGKAHHPRLTRKSAPILKVTLDNGATIRCTKDHLFLMRDGTYKPASTLAAGSSLMPLYTRLSNKQAGGRLDKYEEVYNPGTDKWSYTHRVVAEATYGPKVEKRTVDHHIDFNKYNNTPENLQRLSWAEHTELHARSGETLISWRRSPEGREAARQSMLKLWADPEWRAKRVKINGQNGKRRFAELVAKGKPVGFQTWTKDQYKLAGLKSGAVRKGVPLQLSEEQRQGRSKRMKDRWQNPEYYARESERLKSLNDRHKAPLNHKVIAIEFVGHEDVFDLTVDTYHNFALSAGVFVHNCMFLYGYGAYKDTHADGQNSWGCYDDQTEVLTSRGWKRFKDVSDFDTIATLNPNTHHLEYQPIWAKHVYPYKGDLHSYQSDYVDLLVTPNHNMYVQGKEKQTQWRIVPSERISQKYLHFKKNAEWSGIERNTIQVGEHVINMDLWLEFLGYFLSEGYVSHRAFTRPERIRIRKYNAGDGSIRDAQTGRFVSGRTNVTTKTYSTKENARTQNDWCVGVCQTKQQNLDTIESCLRQLPFKFTRSSNTWTTNNKQLFDELQQFGKSSDKFIPHELLYLSARQLKILFDALMLGDGTDTGGKYCYYTASKTLADQLQEIGLKIGLACDITCVNRRGTFTTAGYRYNHLEYQVKIKRIRVAPSYTHGRQSVQYDGNVYCLTVPNHIMYVRRNGKAVWCGNSNWGDGGDFHIPFSYLTNKKLCTDLFAIDMIT